MKLPVVSLFFLLPSLEILSDFCLFWWEKNNWRWKKNDRLTMKSRYGLASLTRYFCDSIWCSYWPKKSTHSTFNNKSFTHFNLPCWFSQQILLKCRWKILWVFNLIASPGLAEGYSLAGQYKIQIIVFIKCA